MREKAGMLQKDKLKIRHLEFSDIKSVAEIEKECFSMPWSEQAFEEELHLDTAICFVAHLNDEVAGFVNGRIVLDEFYINNVAVASRFRKKGIGEALINDLCDYIKHIVTFITLEVRESNIPAQNLYKKCGFKVVGKRKDFYEKPTENAILMTKYF
jgi:ribosomal-protein-alanine N-acetyltransferase